MKSFAGMVPEALNALSPEERHRIYKMPRLKVIAKLDRELEINGALTNEVYLNEHTPKRRSTAALSGPCPECASH